MTNFALNQLGVKFSILRLSSARHGSFGEILPGQEGGTLIAPRGISEESPGSFDVILEEMKPHPDETTPRLWLVDY